jgi:hypothetical protein
MVFQDIQYTTILCAVLALLQILVIFAFQLAMYCNLIVHIVHIVCLKENSILPSPISQHVNTPRWNL